MDFTRNDTQTSSFINTMSPSARLLLEKHLKHAAASSEDAPTSTTAATPTTTTTPSPFSASTTTNTQPGGQPPPRSLASTTHTTKQPTRTMTSTTPMSASGSSFLSTSRDDDDDDFERETDQKNSSRTTAMASSSVAKVRLVEDHQPTAYHTTAPPTTTTTTTTTTTVPPLPPPSSSPLPPSLAPAPSQHSPSDDYLQPAPFPRGASMTTWSSPSSSGDTGDLAASFEPEQDHDDSQGHDSLMHDTPSEAHQEQAIATLLADTSIRQPPSAAVRNDNDDVGGANQDDTTAAAAHQQPQQFTPSPPPPTSMSPARPPHVAVPAAQTPHTPSTPHSAQISLEQLYVVDGFTPTPSTHAAAAEAPPRDHTPAAVAGRHAIHGYVRECARSVLKGSVEKRRVGMPPPSPNTNTKAPWRGPRYFMCISKTQTSPQNMLGAATPKTPTSPARWSARDARSPGLASLSAYGAVSSPNGAEGVGTSADVARAIRRFERDMLATKGDLAAERAQHDELRSQIKRMREALPAQRAALLERIAAVYGSATRGRMRCRACFAAWRRLAASEAATHAMVAAMRSLDGALVSKRLARDVQAADAIQAIYNALAPLARRLQPMGAFVAWRHVVDTSRALLEQAPAGPAFAFRLLSRFERVAALAARSDARRLRAALRIFNRRAQQIGARRTALGQVAASIARRRPGSKPRVIFAAWRRYACPRAGADRAAKSRRRLLLLRSIHHWRRIALASAREHINLGGMRKGRENEVNVNSASDVLNKLRFIHAEAARTRGNLVSLKHEATVKMAALKEKCRRRQEVCQGLASNYERFKQRSRVFHAWRRETCSLESAAGGGGRESMMSMLRHAFAPASISTAAATVVVADDDFVSASEKPRSPIATPNELRLLGDIGILRQQLRAAAAEKKRARTSPGPDFGKPPPRSTSNLTSSPTTRSTKPLTPRGVGAKTTTGYAHLHRHRERVQ